MGQSAIAVVALVFIVFSIAAAVAWVVAEWHLFIEVGLTLGALASFSALVYSMTRRDMAPDFLRRVTRSYFERDGFTFAIVPQARDGVCYMRILFQNRFSEPCEAQVVLKPSRQFFMTRRPIDQVAVGIKCDGGAFGDASVPWGIPKQFQGKSQNTDIGASVRWPHGKGEMLRFRDGMPTRGPKLDAFQVTTTVAGALGGMIVLHTPARCRIRLPANVAESVPDDSPIEFRTLWRPGDAIEMVELPSLPS